jgi:hypothetical protein
MSALITLPPVLIDSTNYSRGENASQSASLIWGVFESSGDIYLLLLGQEDACPPYSDPEVMKMWKTSDLGNTWAAAGTAPDNGGQNNMTSFFRADKVGPISVLYQYGAGDRGAISDFTAATDTWGAATADLQITRGGAAGSPFISDGYWFCKNGSDYWYFCQNQSRSTNKGVYYRWYTGGVWGAETQIEAIADNTARLLGGFLDENTNNMHIIYTTGNGGSTFHRSITNAGVVSGATDLAVVGNVIGFPSEFVVRGTNFFFGYADLVSNIFKAAISPIAAPALTISSLYNFTGTQSVQDAAAFLDNSGSAVVSYILFDSGASVLDRSIYMYRNNGGGWAAQEQVYDGVANQPTIPGFAYTVGAHSLTGIQLSDDNWLFGTAFDFDDGSCFPCAGFALITTSGDGNISDVLGFIDSMSASKTVGPGPFPPPTPGEAPTACPLDDN